MLDRSFRGPILSSIILFFSASFRACSNFNSSAAFLRSRFWKEEFSEISNWILCNQLPHTLSFLFLSGVMNPPFFFFFASFSCSSRARTSAFRRSLSDWNKYDVWVENFVLEKVEHRKESSVSKRLAVKFRHIFIFPTLYSPVFQAWWVLKDGVYLIDVFTMWSDDGEFCVNVFVSVVDKYVVLTDRNEGEGLVLC